jgi:hypothetical protein
MLTTTFNEINDLADYGIFCSAATQHLVVAAAAADVEMPQCGVLRARLCL